MKPKHFLLRTFAVSVLITGSFLTIFADNQGDLTSKLLVDKMYRTTDSTGDTTGSGDGGPIVFPTGH